MTTVDERVAGALVRGTALVLLGDVLGVGGSFLARLVAARHLGPDGYGVVVLGLTFLNVLATLAVLGLPEGLARQLPRLDDPSGAVRRPLLAAAAVAVGVSALLFAGADRVAAVLGEAALAPVLVVVAAALPLVVVVRLLVGALRGMEAVGARVVVENVCYQAGACAAVVAGAAVGAGAVGVTASWLLAGGAATVVGAYAVADRYALLRGAAPAEASLGRTVAFSLPLMASHGLWMLVEQSDGLVLAYFEQAAAVGVYDASFTVGRMLLVLNSAASFLLLPLFSRLHDEGDDDAIRRRYRFVTKAVVVVAVPAYCLLVAVPDLVLGLVFGPAYATGAVLAVVATGFFAHVATGVNGNALIAVGRTRTVLRGNLYCLVSNLALNAALVPAFGPLGAAVASAVSYGLATAYWGYHLYHEVRIPVVYPAVAKGLAVGVGPFVLFAAAGRTWAGGSLPWPAVVAAFVVTYAVTVVTVLDRSELYLLRSTLLLNR